MPTDILLNFFEDAVPLAFPPPAAVFIFLALERSVGASGLARIPPHGCHTAAAALAVLVRGAFANTRRAEPVGS